MRTILLLLLASLLLAPAVTAATATVHGEAAGIPFSVGPAPAPVLLCTLGFWYETEDLGVFYSTGYGYGGHCDFYVRAG